MRINRVYLTEKKYSFLEIQHDNLKFIKSQQRYFHVQRLKKASIKYSTNFHLYKKMFHGIMVTIDTMEHFLYMK